MDDLWLESEVVSIESAVRTGNIAHIRGLLTEQVNAGISFLTFKSAETFTFTCLNYNALINKDYQCFVYASLSNDGIYIYGRDHAYKYTAFDVYFFVE